MLIEILIHVRDGIQILAILLISANPSPGGLFDCHSGMPPRNIAVADGFNIRSCVPVALIDSGAESRRFSPSRPRTQVLLPKRPGAALQRALGIHLASRIFLTVSQQEDTVFARLFFDQAVSKTDAVGVFPLKILGSKVEDFCHPGDFLFA